jgi:NADPH-dependent curcumin reductase
MQNTQIIKAAHPQGMVTLNDFSVKTYDLPPLLPNQILVKIDYISLDPAIRGWMNPGTTYIKGIEIGEVIRTFSIGEVIESKNENFKVGEYVWGLMGSQKYAISDGNGLMKADISDIPISWYLGLFGMPGMTAYFGLLEKGKPQKGETVFISGAAGIVGATVGQIAKIKGCRVVGTAGSDEKCAYLVNELGFDVAINYKKETDLLTALKREIPEGISIYFDNVGGDSLDAALVNLARGARVVICGAISQYNSTNPLGPKNYMKIVTARGYITGIIVFDYFGEYQRFLKDMSQWNTQGKLSTKEDMYEGLENFPEILLKLYNGDNFGKLILKV